MSKQTIIIIALISFGLGFIGNIYYKSTTDDTFQSGWEAAKQRLEEIGYFPMMEGMEITSVNGRVEEVKDNKISLKISPLEPLADSDLDNRIVEVDENTKIYQLVGRDPEQYQKETEEFNQRMQEQMANPEAVTEPVMLPEPYTKQEISLADIEIGQQITVRTEEDIKDIKQFKAIEITVQSVPVIPGGGIITPEGESAPGD